MSVPVYPLESQFFHKDPKLNYFPLQVSAMMASLPAWSQHAEQHSSRKQTVQGLRHVHTNDHSSFPHNSRKVETTQMAISRGTQRQNVVHTCNGTVFELKKEGNSETYYNMDVPWGYAKWNKPDTKGQILCDLTDKRDLEQRQKIEEWL